MKLTKRNIEALPTPKQAQIIFDEDLAGFGLRVSAAGRKVFVVQYRVGGGRNGRQRRVSVGVFGTITTEHARATAKEILAKAHLGQDHAEQRDRVRKARTVSELIDLWAEEGAPINRRTGALRKPVNVRGEIAVANHHLKHLIGSRNVDSLIRADIERLRGQIAKGESKTRVKGRKRGVSEVKGGDGTATRTIRLFSSILSFAVDRAIIDRNPALGIRLAPSGQRHRFLSPSEMQRLGEVLERPANKPVEGVASLIIKLLILTGARRGEVETLRWAEVDFEFGMLRLPTSKTGAKVIPLARVAIELLKEQRRWAPRGSSWVFPATKGDGHFDGLGKEWSRIRKAAGIPDVRVHDLRHTFASVGAGGGVSLPLIGGILGHRQPSTTQRYAHLADKPLRSAANVIGSEIAAALFGSTALASATAERAEA